MSIYLLMRIRHFCRFSTLVLLLTTAGAQTYVAPSFRAPMLESTIERALRYRPEGTDFVIENGELFFNRPLYGPNTAFRIDAGDRPEFSLYLPGRGGNLRLALIRDGRALWLHEAKQIETRYRAGSMLYAISDPLLGGNAVTVQALPLAEREGLVLRIQLRGTASSDAGPLYIGWAYGGVTGQRGKRDGDLGTEAVPISDYFQLQPSFCMNNRLGIGPEGFTLDSPVARIHGVVPADSEQRVIDANLWTHAAATVFAAPHEPASQQPVIVGQAGLPADAPVLLALQRVPRPQDDRQELPEYRAVRQERGVTEIPLRVTAAPLARHELPAAFAAAERHRSEISRTLQVDTPDPFINAAAAALNTAADAVWDEAQGAVVHGAVAWRTKLLGWRGPYVNDALGRHDRARRHITHWVGNQNTDPIPATLPPPDEDTNLARSEAALHSNGDLSHSHYDMNLVYIDAVFRHLRWTGDRALAEELWPVIERHLAWERRLFRRPFGSDGAPLYEAYAAIWASDDIGYNGGGTTHASAYNYWHNLMAARVAQWIGRDGSAYATEAKAVHAAMSRELWLPERGWFAEYHDLLGLQQAHPSAALWTFYHTIDSDAASPFQAYQATRYIDTQRAHIPLRGPGVPPGFHTLPTTDWMPYIWSTNNVVMSEVMHTALGYWQSQRPAEAWRLFKGALLDSMFLGKCPGNAGMCTAFDMARGETQRDFADSIGMTARSLVEGLFGIRPDAINGELVVSPGFPTDWDHARLAHTSVDFAYQRDGDIERFLLEPRFPNPQALRLQVRARGTTGQPRVVVNGQSAVWRAIDSAIGDPRIEIRAPAASRFEVIVTWSGAQPSQLEAPAVVASGETLHISGPAGVRLVDLADPQGVLANGLISDNTLHGTIAGRRGHRTLFVRLSEGVQQWWEPLHLEVRPPIELRAAEDQRGPELRFRIRNNTGKSWQGPAQVRLGSDHVTLDIAAPARDESAELRLPAKGLAPGTQRIEIRASDGRVLIGEVVHWGLAAQDGEHGFETVPLGTVFNARMTDLFRNEYRAPRSPYVSLAVPKHGFGSWCRPHAQFDVDDSGLRQSGHLDVNGVPFEMVASADAANVIFTSQWDNYPEAREVPLNGRARRVYVIVAGTTHATQSRFDNGEIVVTYSDGSTTRLALHNPTTWWPIDQDYLIDDFAFRRPEPIPPRVDLATGEVRIATLADVKGRRTLPPGGAATVLDLPLDPDKDLQSLTVRTLANEVVVGLLAATLLR